MIYQGSINTFRPGANPLHVPAGPAGVAVLIAAGISNVGTLPVVTSAQAGILTPILSLPGPVGSTFALSTVALYSYAFSGSPDTITLSGIPGGGVALLSMSTYPGVGAALQTSASASGGAEPMLLPIGASVAGAVVWAGQLYDWTFGSQGWVAQFTVNKASNAPDESVNYDAINYTLDTGYYLTPTGLGITAQDSAPGNVWAAVGGAWA